MFLSVPGTLDDMNEQERAEWSLKIASARTRLGLSKEAAAKKAGVTTTTWRRAEAGESLQDAKFAAVLAAVDLSLEEGGTPLPQVDIIHPPQPTLFLLPAELEQGYAETVRFTRTVGEHVPSLRRDATRLMLEASRLFTEAGERLVGGGEHGGHAAPIDEDEESLMEDLAAYGQDEHGREIPDSQHRDR